MKIRSILTALVLIVAFTILCFLNLAGHFDPAVSANSQQSNPPSQEVQQPLILQVEKGPGKWPIYRLEGKVVDPLRGSGDAVEKYGRGRALIVVVDMRLSLDIFDEASAYPEKAGFTHVKTFAYLGNGTMSEVIWGPAVPVPGGWKTR